jgi:hypothetical protein
MPRKLWVPVLALGLALSAIAIPAVQSPPDVPRATMAAPVAYKDQRADLRNGHGAAEASRPADEVAFNYSMRKAGGKDERKAGERSEHNDQPSAFTMIERKAG